MIEIKDDTVITEELIALAEPHRPTSEFRLWLRRQPRSWAELKRYDSSWAAWAMMHITELSIDLSGLKNLERAWVMVFRPDCEVNLSGFSSAEMALVMIERTDCPVDISMLDDQDAAEVRANRLDTR